MTTIPSRIRLPYQPSWRDRLAHRLANAALRIASPTYRALLRGTYVAGMEHVGACEVSRS